MPPPPEPACALPPELLGNDPAGYAWSVWHDRTPRLVAQVRDGNPFGPAQRRALDALAAEIASGVMLPLSPGARDGAAWAARGAGYFGKPWLDAPFLWAESYFHRRLLAATGFFEPGPWQGLDPFEFLKSAELSAPGLRSSLAALDDLGQLGPAGQERALLEASLWGNQADLGFLTGASAGAGEPGPARLIADQSADLGAALGPDAHVVVVADNAGRELAADLVLIDDLLRHGRAASVSLQLKPWPYYVSDATGHDLSACLRRLAAAPGSAAAAAGRLRAALAGGSLVPGTHEFYCAPLGYRDMPADLAATLGRADLTIFKGDLNYRRLVGDRAWPATAPFSEVTSYFPGRAAALRTLKCDVVTGLDAATVADLDAAGRPWRTDGHHALIQVA